MQTISKRTLRVSVVLGAAVLLGLGAAPADIRTREVPFTHDGATVKGLIAWNDQVKAKRPGVLVIHSLWGYNDHVREQVRRLADAGYVGYAFDMGGAGPVPTHIEHGPTMTAQSAIPLPKKIAKFNAAMEALKRDPHVDPNRISAIGYCWGGSVILDMARSGVGLDSVVTFHGTLTTQTPAQKDRFKSRVLVLTGALDPYAPAQAVEAFRKEMTDAGAKFEIVTYPGVMHAFTEPYAKQEIVDLAGQQARGVDRGIKYDAGADAQSWAAMLKLFKEIYP
jgi:dienelactone hydrolase